MTDEHFNIETSKAAMAERYPSLEFHVEERDGKPVGIWEGWLQPIRSRVGLNGILLDLDANRQIKIDRETASIAHSPKCTESHKQQHPIFDRLKRPDRPFRVRIEYIGGAAHPRAWLLDPVVKAATRYHMFGENRICAYPPQTNVWRAEENTVADFTDHVLVWTFKWNTWVETGYCSDLRRITIHSTWSRRLDRKWNAGAVRERPMVNAAAGKIADSRAWRWR